CWGIRNIEFRKDAPQVKLGFMMQLARMFSSHVDFWDASERAFFASANARHKLAKFPITDPHIKSLASSSGSAGYILYDLIIKHMDSGKRIGQLRPRIRTSVAAPNAA